MSLGGLFVFLNSFICCCAFSALAQDISCQLTDTHAQPNTPKTGQQHLCGQHERKIHRDRVWWSTGGEMYCVCFAMSRGATEKEARGGFEWGRCDFLPVPPTALFPCTAPPSRGGNRAASFQLHYCELWTSPCTPQGSSGQRFSRLLALSHSFSNNDLQTVVMPGL